MTTLTSLPDGLPVPDDDGAAEHLEGTTLPDIELACTDSSTVNLSKLEGRCVIYVYPMTGRPGSPLAQGWDEIPGARGCTPQSCSFRDHYTELQAMHTGVFGLSAQSRDDQTEARERLHLPFQLLSDHNLKLKALMRLPTFTFNGLELYKRLTFISNNSLIEKVFYPVFPPDRNIDDVLDWFKSGI